MKIVCGPKGFKFSSHPADLHVVLFGKPNHDSQGAAGWAIAEVIRKRKIAAAPRAWDFLAIAMSVICADLRGHRKQSSDGWTRTFDLSIAVSDRKFWETQKESLEAALQFLTTDRWTIGFLSGGYVQPELKKKIIVPGDCVTLLSGGLDSLIGCTTLSRHGRSPITVSHTVRGDGDKQAQFPKAISSAISTVRLNHNAEVSHSETPPSQRSRSLAFIAYGVLIASSLSKPKKTKTALLVCENGFMTLNPPLTAMRVGSLSTRTTHPGFLGHIQDILSAAGLATDLENPHRFQTKGEMLVACPDQALIKNLAHQSTSCGRFKQYGYKHCGRCVPCLIRRAAFFAWGVQDTTFYKFDDIGRNDPDYAGFDDVRAVAMAALEAKKKGISRWIGSTLATVPRSDRADCEDVARRGLEELGAFLRDRKVR
jgi:hypothetical protein